MVQASELRWLTSGFPETSCLRPALVLQTIRILADFVPNVQRKNVDSIFPNQTNPAERRPVQQPQTPDNANCARRPDIPTAF